MLRKIWRRLTAPTFSVTTMKANHTSTGAVIAGQRTKVCTIFICFHSDPILGRHREEIRFPRPSFNNIPPGIKVSYGEDRRPRREELELDVYVHVTSAGTYSITPEFPKNLCNFRHIDQIPVDFCVKPSELKFIEISSIAPFPGHGKALSVYRGGNVEILLTARDEFGNITVESDLEFKAVSENSVFTLLSATRYVQRERYIVTLRCQQVGVASFDLVLLTHTPHPHPVVKVTDLRIIPPPASPTDSYIIQNDLQSMQETIHEAGHPITFKLALFDIFGYPVTSLNDIAGDIRLTWANDCHTNRSCGDDLSIEKTKEEELQRLKKEVDSLKVRSLDSADPNNIFELQFTPLFSGRKCFLLILSEEELRSLPITITVEPGPLLEIKIVRHEPPASNQNLVISYPTEQRAVVVKGIDAFANTVDLDLTEWFLSETQHVNMMEVDDSFLDENAKVISFHYNHGKKGRYLVTVKPKSPTKNYIKVPQFVVEVGSAPIDPSRCDVRICQEQPVFTGHFRCLQLRVVFVSCIGEGYMFPDRDIGHLSVTVDNVVFKPTFKHSSKRSEACLLLPELQEGGMKKIQVRYKESCLGCLLTVNVVGLVPFMTDDYLEVYQEERKISCIGVAHKHFVGADCANIKNISRILEKEYPGNKLSQYNVTEECEGVAVFNLSSFQLEAFWRVFVLLSLLLRGAQHFRSQANDFGDEKGKWKEKATEAYYAGNHQQAKVCKAIKEKYGELMNESHRRASDVIFKFYNYGRPQSQIDLHGQLVGNTEKAHAYKQQLLTKGEKSTAEVDAMIEKERGERDEAIRKLDERVRDFDHEEAKRDGEDWLEIIDGAGHHSARRGEQKIRPKVKEYLEKKNMKYVEANEGALLVTFSKYTGREPCVADFYCTRCTRKWTSTTSWKGLFQRCHRCDAKGIISNCYPFKMRTVLPPQRRQRTNNFTRNDHVRLCEMCTRLGRDCGL